MHSSRRECKAFVRNRQFHVSAFKFSAFKLNLLFTLFKIPRLAYVTNLNNTDDEKILNTPSWITWVSHWDCINRFLPNRPSDKPNKIYCQFHKHHECLPDYVIYELRSSAVVFSFYIIIIIIIIITIKTIIVIVIIIMFLFTELLSLVCLWNNADPHCWGSKFRTAALSVLCVMLQVRLCFVVKLLSVSLVWLPNIF